MFVGASPHSPGKRDERASSQEAFASALFVGRACHPEWFFSATKDLCIDTASGML